MRYPSFVCVLYFLHVFPILPPCVLHLNLCLHYPPRMCAVSSPYVYFVILLFCPIFPFVYPIRPLYVSYYLTICASSFDLDAPLFICVHFPQLMCALSYYYVYSLIPLCSPSIPLSFPILPLGVSYAAPMCIIPLCVPSRPQCVPYPLPMLSSYSALYFPMCDPSFLYYPLCVCALLPLCVHYLSFICTFIQ